MSGGKIQIISVGFEDIYLTFDPQITFFKMVYKRYTNFSQEPIIQYFNADTPSFGQRMTCSIAKTADLISNIYLFVELPSIPISNNIDYFNYEYKWNKKIGYSLIRYTELEINGQLIDKLYSDWLNIWSLLTINDEHQKSEDILVGNVSSLFDYSNGKDSYKLYVPLNFFFNRNKSLSLPIIALQVSDVKIHVEFNNLKEVLIPSYTHYIEIEDNTVFFEKNDIIKQNFNDVEVIEGLFHSFDYETKKLYFTKYNKNFQSYNERSNYNKEKYNIFNDTFQVTPKSDPVYINPIYPNIDINKSHLIVNFIYLDNDERKKFIFSNHEYLITNIQYSGEKVITNINSKVKLDFINCSKQLIWIAQYDKILRGTINDKFNYTSNLNYTGSNIIEKTALIQNGNIRSKEGDKYLYSYLQNYIYYNSNINEGINLFSFSIDPMSHQPTGACNFSKINDFSLDIKLISDISYDNPVIIKVFSHGYNVLRINNGIGKLVFI